MKIYLALDGTKDVTNLIRAKTAALVGPTCMACILPTGLDPDELSADDIIEVKSESKDSLVLWLECIQKMHNPIRAQEVVELASAIVNWNKKSPAKAADRRVLFCNHLKYTFAEYEIILQSCAKSATIEQQDSNEKQLTVSEIAFDIDYPNQPESPGVPKDDDLKPSVSNFDFESDDDGKVRLKALSIRKVVNQVKGCFNGYPMRYGKAGDMNPYLFMPNKDGTIRLIVTASQLETLCMEYSKLSIRPKSDSRLRNFVTFNHLYHYFGGSVEVSEFVQLEFRPHHPPMANHFYSNKPSKYRKQADCRYLCMAMDLFDNIREPAQKVLFAASLVTPFWGGPCGARPAFIFVADDVGHGKGRATELIGAAAGGMIELEPGRRAEEQLKERLLSGDSYYKRIIRMDNAKGALNSPLIESIITAPDISGKKMYKGEGTRPNNLTLLVTANNVRVSPDMGRRSMFIQMSKPTPNSGWDAQYEFLMKKADGLCWDAIHLLQQPPPPEPNLKGLRETFGLWAREVLARVAAHPMIIDSIGRQIDVREIIENNKGLREDVDMMNEEAQDFEYIMMQYIVNDYKLVFLKEGEEGYEESYHWLELKKTSQKIQIKNTDIHLLWNRYVDRNTRKNRIGIQIRSHINAARIQSLVPFRLGKSRGLTVNKDSVNAFIQSVIDGSVLLDTSVTLES